MSEVRFTDSPPLCARVFERRLITRQRLRKPSNRTRKGSTLVTRCGRAPNAFLCVKDVRGRRSAQPSAIKESSRETSMPWRRAFRPLGPDCCESVPDAAAPADARSSPSKSATACRERRLGPGRGHGPGRVRRRRRCGTWRGSWSQGGLGLSDSSDSSSGFPEKGPLHRRRVRELVVPAPPRSVRPGRGRSGRRAGTGVAEHGLRCSQADLTRVPGTSCRRPRCQPRLAAGSTSTGPGGRTANRSDQRPILVSLIAGPAAKLPANPFFLGQAGLSPDVTLGDIADAVLYFGREPGAGTLVR